MPLNDMQKCMESIKKIDRRLDAMRARRRDRRNDEKRREDDVEPLNAQEREAQFR